MEFTFNAYEGLIRNINNAGYDWADYHNFHTFSHPCILRHDVDFDMEKAAFFAETEERIGIDLGIRFSSTYFLLLNTEFYNLYSKDNRSRIERIVRSGHHIGLHFDETRYPIDKGMQNASDFIYAEIKALTEIVGQDIDTISMHRPSEELLKADLQLSGLINVYGRAFFDNMKYFSDSRMHWRENVELAVAEKRYTAIHILTHPFWYDEKESNPEKLLEHFIRQATTDRYNALRENISDFDTLLCKQAAQDLTANGDNLEA